MVKAQLLITAAAVAAVGAFSPNAPQTVRSTTGFRSSFDSMSGEEEDKTVVRVEKIE